MNEFIVRENIRLYRRLLLAADHGARRDTISGLLETEERLLSEWLSLSARY